jgi:hypothetical protein
MSDDDTRWADRLLERARATAAPRTEDAARNLASIEARLGSGPGMTPDVAPDIAARIGRVEGGLSTRGAAVKGTLASRALVKGSLVLVFGVGTGIVGYLIGRAETARTRDPIAAGATATAMPAGLGREAIGGEATANAPTVAGASEPPAAPAAPTRNEPASTAARPAARAAAARAVAEHRPRAARPVPAPASEQAHVFELSEALELLRRAESAVRRADGLEARMWLSDLDRRAPPQLLLEERLVTRTLADCLVGDVDAARATLRELEASNPESIYRARLEGSCVADRMRVADRTR